MTSTEVVDMSRNISSSGDRLNASLDEWLKQIDPEWMADLERSFKDSLYTYKEPLTATLIGLYVVVFVLSIVGNTLVIVIIRLDKSNRGVDAYLMLNLAVADLLGKLNTTITFPPVPGTLAVH